MLPIQYLSKLIKILRSAASPSQIAGGFILGMVIGLSPTFLSLTNLVIILIIIILNVNITTAIFAMAIFSGFAYLLDPAFHSLGYSVLVDSNGLRNLWVMFYNAPLVPFTRFNNTIVMGSFIVALILLLPMFFLVKRFIIQYREKYEPRVKNWKWIKFIKSTAVYQWYERLKFLGD
jgi:uncharacterized protein (TIGR03546 family)